MQQQLQGLCRQQPTVLQVALAALLLLRIEVQQRQQQVLLQGFRALVCTSLAT
jgi:hypothetical protein